MKYLFLAAVIATSYVAVSAFVWKDCAAPNSDTTVTVHSFNLSPNPANLPGDLHVTLNLTVNKPISQLFIDVDMTKKTIIGSGAHVPCIQGTNIGSCQNIDACSILTDILNGTSVVSVDLGLQLEKILAAALGHKPSCPVSPETVSISNQVFTLQAIPTSLSVIADGNYHIKVSIKDDPTSSANVGCLEFDFGIKRKSSGFLFG